MNTLSKRDWEILKRPVYPNIQFYSEGNKVQVQSMLGLMIEGTEYYLPVIIVREIKEISDFWALTESYTQIIQELVHGYTTKGSNIEEDENVYKIEE